MKTHRFLTYFLILFCVTISLNSEAIEGPQGKWRNTIFRPEIKSVQFYSSEEDYTLPMLTLGSDEEVILKFDDLSEGTASYNYTILHCDADWNESFVMQNEYLDGLTDNPLEDFALNFNTTVGFMNYRLTLPNDRVKFNYSGNYILCIYEGDNRENLVLTRRFFVLEPKVTVKGLVKRATFDPYLGSNQEVDFAVFHELLRLDDPFQEIKVTMLKNRCWDMSISGLKPRFVKKQELDYDYDEQNVFPGGNEFRYFDMRSWEYTGENVARIEEFNNYYHVTLARDEIRSNKKFFQYAEMNGRFSVESQDRIEDPDTDCDYGFVHFRLAVPTPLVGGAVYVYGDLTDWTCSEQNKMEYNSELKEYQLSLLLKQGYYNYEYVYVHNGETKVDESVLEGSFFETENEYQILVYYKALSGRYDRLVGFQQLSSQN